MRRRAGSVAPRTASSGKRLPKWISIEPSTIVESITLRSFLSSYVLQGLLGCVLRVNSRFARPVPLALSKRLSAITVDSFGTCMVDYPAAKRSCIVVIGCFLLLNGIKDAKGRDIPDGSPRVDADVAIVV